MCNHCPSVTVGLTWSVMRSMSKAVGSSGDEIDLRWSWSLESCTQRIPSRLEEAFMSFRSTSRALPCLSLIGSKYTWPRSWVPSIPWEKIQNIIYTVQLSWKHTANKLWYLVDTNIYLLSMLPVDGRQPAASWGVSAEYRNRTSGMDWGTAAARESPPIDKIPSARTAKEQMYYTSHINIILLNNLLYCAVDSFLAVITCVTCVLSILLSFLYFISLPLSPFVYLSKPEEVLHEGAGVGIFNLHNGNLILWSH